MVYVVDLKLDDEMLRLREDLRAAIRMQREYEDGLRKSPHVDDCKCAVCLFRSLNDVQ